MDHRGGRGKISRGMIPVLAIHVASEFYRLRRKPPVTAGLILANTLIYLRPGPLHRLLPSIDEVWFNPHLIIKHRDMKRFFLSAFYHLGESHLVYNMMSLLWKGTQLETSLGSLEFSSTVAALLCLSQGLALLLAKALLVFSGDDSAYYDQYAAGFSGVLFAMKVVLNSQSDDLTSMNGLLVPARYAAWAELILIQMFVPGVSFIGHLGGILAGLLYLRLRRAYSGADPLSALIRKVVTLVRWPVSFLRGLIGWPARRISGRGTVGGVRAAGRAGGVWRCAACTFDNSWPAEVCGMCGTGGTEDGFSARAPSYVSGEQLSLEEVRRRRIERFSR